MTEDGRLRSHSEPVRSLQRHVEEVRQVASALFGGHPAKTIDLRPGSRAMLDAMVRCHDLGKGSEAFQAYIRNGRKLFRNDPLVKSHTALGGAMAILWAREQRWPRTDALALALGVLGHHSGFHPLEDLAEKLRLLEDHEGLSKQWSTLDASSLSETCGLNLPLFLGEPRPARRWLFRGVGIRKELERMPIAKRFDFRLWVQFLFAILLEADKAFLAVGDKHIERYLKRSTFDLGPDLVDAYLHRQRTSMQLASERQTAAKEILTRWDSGSRCEADRRLVTLTLPTGMGKTLIAARWALRERQCRVLKGSPPPRIFIVLPYLSIIDQTQQIYRELLGVTKAAEQSDLFLESHSVSDRRYDLGDNQEEGAEEFFLDTWKSEVVVTTFDKLLQAVFDKSSRHLMRFHNLFDSLIVLDEVQVIPCNLWDPVRRFLEGLVRESSSAILLMTATQPGLLGTVEDLAGDASDIDKTYARFNRYRIELKHKSPKSFEEFEDEMADRSTEWLRRKEKVLLTLNTRATARSTFARLLALHGDQYKVYLLSADVTPRDRLEKLSAIHELRSDEPCLIVATQCVEAGVDIDVDVVVRDFAPLDSIIQIAGRCNRHGLRSTGRIELVQLHNDTNRSYCEMIYDRVQLAVTKNVLGGRPSIEERDVLDLVRRYYACLKESKDTGEALSASFSLWSAWPDGIQTLLRGAPMETHQFLVIDEGRESDREVEAAFRSALTETDRWSRRRGLRRVAGEIQRRTVSVYAKRGFDPEDYGSPIGSHWLLRPGYYSSEAGLNLNAKERALSCVF